MKRKKIRQYSDTDILITMNATGYSVDGMIRITYWSLIVTNKKSKFKTKETYYNWTDVNTEFNKLVRSKLNE